MNLFQKSVEKKYLNELDSVLIDKKYKAFQDYFGNPSIQENIRNSKEEQFQEGFLRELFVSIFEYTLNPQPNFNLTTELKNIANSKKADGAILKGKEAIAVIELKGTDISDLDKIETQAFGYKNHHPKCVYVITSNFEKLRFYIQNAVDYIDFDLFNLTREQFSLMWLCLAKDDLLNGLPQKIKESSLLQEENISKKLYADYSKFREAIYNNLVKNNPETDKLLLFKKTQKLLDRFLFIFFGEDRLLLPSNSISEIVKQWTTLKDELDEYVPLYDRFKKYFGYMNTGYKGKKYDIFAYNGGLFAPDEILDNISIDDEILYEHTLKLSSYDFETDVDVNILGHIFEHSLGEIENVQAEIAASTPTASIPTASTPNKGFQPLGKPLGTPHGTPPVKSKRKKDGIFYTPKYITKYIVENTVGKLCEEKRNELDIVDEEYAKGRKNRKKDTIKTLDEKLTDYRNWLLSLTILDPACGSGAFLNQALDFLITEHRKIDDLRAQLLGGGIIFPDITTDILEKNIYGVDINEESVEIAKLSLWLRTAQKGRKLNTLSNNIKCGNSLIDDPEVAGEKAFNWQNEFPTVFQEKEKKAFHITTATHDSRTSQRMIDYKVREKRDEGLRPKAQPVWLELEDELIITQTVAEIVKEDKLNVMAYNICGDHMHLLLVCEEKEVNNIVGKIKGITSRVLHSNKGINPLVRKGEEKSISLWTQKFGRKEIKDEKQLWNTVEYIQNNRVKHDLPENKKLQAYIKEIECDYEHAFRTEYKGGFDVVVGNPPYVQLQKLKETSEHLKKIGYKTYESTGDLYCLFYEKGNILLKPKGVLGYITSNKWMRANYGKSLRKYFLQNTTPYQLLDLGAGIFKAAVVDSNILLFEKKKSINISIPSLDISEERIVIDFIHYKNKFIEIQPKNDDVWTISSKTAQTIKEKVEKSGIPLKDWGVEIKYGIKTGLNNAFIIDKEKRKELIASDPKSEEIIVPVLRGRDVNRYQIDYQDLYLINSHNGYNNIPRINIDDYPAIKKHLEQFEPQLSKRYDKGETPYNLRNCAYVDDFEMPNIFYPDIDQKLSFVWSDNNFFITNTGYFLRTDDKYLLAVLNSKLINYYYKSISAQLGSNGIRLFTIYIEKIPIKKIALEQQIPFIDKSNLILSLNQNFQQISKLFIDLLNSKFYIEKLSKKLQNWHELAFKDFLKELKKAKVQLSLSEEAEWMQYFNEQKQKAQALKTEIAKTDSEIDLMVYKLYGLTEEEIKIVEKSI